MPETDTGSAGTPVSFRDPNAFVFQRGGVLYRQINAAYLPHYRALMDSGLYAELASLRLLVAHEEAGVQHALDPSLAATVIRPERVPFVSYPWEWSFGQLKAAALLTLEVMSRSLARGMILKDASTRNIQFIGSEPVLIDTSSFVISDGGPWVAYRQFCEHFLVPLALQSYGSPLFREILRGCIDGIPLRDGARALPFRALFSPRLFLHVFGHAWFAPGGNVRHTERKGTTGTVRLADLVESLRLTVEGLTLPCQRSMWSAYRPDSLYGESIEAKKNIVTSVVRSRKPRLVWDLGANDGFFPMLIASASTAVIAMESDPDALERCFSSARSAHANVLPLSVDFNNPTAGGGAMGTEILSLFERGRPELILMLGIIHHLCITQNIPLHLLPAFSRKAGAKNVLVEWIQPDDDRTAPLLDRKPDHHPYNRETFDRAFAGCTLVSEQSVSPTRSLLLFEL